MKREFDYNSISIVDISCNPCYIFICDADSKKVIIESEEEWKRNLVVTRPILNGSIRT